VAAVAGAVMLGLNAAVIGLLLLVCGPLTHKYVVTVPAQVAGTQREVTFETCGTGRIDALARSGLTVWTEKEWSEAQHRIKTFKKKATP